MKLINIVESIILERYEELGKGGWGSVYEKEEKVYKVTESDDEAVVSKGIMNSKTKFKHFPEIYAVRELSPNEYGDERFGIIRKKYSLMKELREFSDISKLVIKYRREIMAYIPNQNNGLPQEVKDNEKLFETITGIIQEFSTLNLPDYKLLDFHIDNLGVDTNGNIVLFDF